MLNKTHAPFGELSASLLSGRHSEPSPRVFLWLQLETLPPHLPHQLCLSGGGCTGKFSEVLQGSSCNKDNPNAFCSQLCPLAVCSERVSYHFPANIFCVYIYLINIMNIHIYLQIFHVRLLQSLVQRLALLFSIFLASIHPHLPGYP